MVVVLSSATRRRLLSFLPRSNSSSQLFKALVKDFDYKAHSMTCKQRDFLHHARVGQCGTTLSSYEECASFQMRSKAPCRLKGEDDQWQPQSQVDLRKLLTVDLLQHQRVALARMLKMETSTVGACRGGILADEQGLGKTLSVIALILATSKKPVLKSQEVVKRQEFESLYSDKDVKISSKCSSGWPVGGNLIVCPPSLLNQWESELRNKVTKEAHLSVLVYHGSDRTQDCHELANYDVVITSYVIVSKEVPYQSPLSNKKGKNCIPGPIAKLRWTRVVLDEAHIMRNHWTRVARVCSALSAECRWCITGTPIQNSIDDLYSYLRFLSYSPYSDINSFHYLVKLPIRRNQIIGRERLDNILKKIMIRRTKSDVVISLPPKTVVIIEIELNERELELYLIIKTGSRALVKKYVDNGIVNLNFDNILVLMTRCRQASSHPYLVRGEDSGILVSPTKENHLPLEKRLSLLKCLKASSATCSICNHSPEAAVVSICGHVFCKKCIFCHLLISTGKCVVPGCKTRIYRSSIFSEATLKSCITDQLIHDDPFPWSSDGCAYVSSPIKALLDILEFEDGKVLVYSQWTRMLDLVESVFKKSSILYRRYDGKISLDERNKSVQDFSTIPEVKVMLMSLKAGSLGLNLVAANCVVLLDLWWNPAVENQAMDRVHRIGQSLPIIVYKFVVKNTIVERVLYIQDKKRKIAESVLGECANGEYQPPSLTVQDLKDLFLLDEM